MIINLDSKENTQDTCIFTVKSIISRSTIPDKMDLYILVFKTHLKLLTEEITGHCLGNLWIVMYHC